jgi:3-oxoisoapionate decarboxylase
MRLGIGTYTFGWAVGVSGYPPAKPMSELDLLQKARDTGVKLLQIGDNLPLDKFEPGRLEKFILQATQDGIDLEVGARRLTIEQIAVYAGIAKRIQAKLVRFVIDDHDYHPSPETIIGVLRESESHLHGLTLALENHDRFSARTLREIIETVGSRSIGVCLDTANSLGAGEGLREVVSTLAPLTFNLHIKDSRIDRVPYLMGFTVQGCPAGTGQMNLPWLLKQLEPFGRCESAILEQWTPPETELEKTVAKEAEWASRSLNYLKPYFS